MDKRENNLYEKVKSGFGDLPEDYFEKLPAQLLKRTHMAKKTSADLTGLLVAASFVLLMTIAVVLLFMFPVNTEKQQIRKVVENVDDSLQDFDYLAFLYDPAEGNAPALNSMQAAVVLTADTTGSKDLSLDEIVMYLIEKEEFEF